MQRSSEIRFQADVICSVTEIKLHTRRKSRKPLRKRAERNLSSI